MINKQTTITPFLKWVGGKRQLLNILDENLPNKIKNEQIENYIEPFIGGGAMFFHIAQKYKIDNYILNDINPNLINCYNQIKNNVNEVIAKLTTLEHRYLTGLDRSEIYYIIRELYNQTINQRTVNNCVYFLFLNKTCFNGLYRVNSKGEFNTPHGKYNNPTICNRDNLIQCSLLLRETNAVITNQSYKEMTIPENSFIYYDPPYRPLSPSGFISYNNSGFNDDNQIELKNVCQRINECGNLFMLSNSDPKNTDINDNFFDDLYSDFNIRRINAKRSINSDGNKRGVINEILVTNY